MRTEDFIERRTKDFNETRNLNMVGVRYVNGNHYVDTTEHYYCIGTLDNPKEFGLGAECSEDVAIAWLS